MAISKTKSITLQAPIASNPHYTLTAQFTEKSTSIANNTSSIYAKATLAVDSSSSFTGSDNGTLSIYWYDNNNNSSGLLLYSMSIGSLSAGTNKYVEKTLNIPHKADGTLSGYAKAVWTKKGGNSAVPASGNISTDNTPLTAIPRKSGIVVTSGAQDISDIYVLIDINRKLNTYTDTIEWTCGNLSETIQTKGSDTKIALFFDSTAYSTTEVPSGYEKKLSAYTLADLMTLIPSTSNETIAFTTTTYNGNTSLGSTTANFNFQVYKSTYANSLAYEVTDNLSLSLTGDDSVIIKGISSVEATNTPTKTINDTSTITSYKFMTDTTPEVDSNSNTITYQNFVGTTLYGSLVDSRTKRPGTTAEIDLTNYILNYFAPSITSLIANRTEETSSTINWSVQGEFWNDDFGEVNNAIHVYYRYKIDNGSYNSYTEVTPTISSNTYSYSGSISVVSTSNATLEVKVVDATLNEYTLTASITKGKSVFDIGEEVMNVNGTLCINGYPIPEYNIIENLLNIIGIQLKSDNKNIYSVPYYPIGSIYITSTNNNPGNLLGGTWELIDKEFEPKYFTATDTDKWYTINSTNTTSGTCYAIRAGHTITIEMTLVTKVALTDSNFDLITFNIQKLGIAANKDFGNANISALVSDVNNGIVMAIWYGGGVVRSFDVIQRGSSTASLPAGANPRGSATWTIRAEDMDDSACNKFYWKRIA